MSEKYGSHKPYRSFFWPVILIGVGVIWLLVNLSIIPTQNTWILLQLWPVLIIVAGLDFLFSRRLSLLGALLALTVIAGVVGILLRGDAFDFSRKPEPRFDSHVVEVGSTTSAIFDLELSHQKTRLSALNDSTHLIEAEIGYFGKIDFTMTDGREKQIRLERSGRFPWFAWLAPGVGDEGLAWDIGLNPNIPFILNVFGSTGHSELDLSGIQLERFFFDVGTGASTIILPFSAAGFEVIIDAGAGALDIALPTQGNLVLRLDGSSGRVLLEAPAGAALRLEVLRGGMGQLITPEWLPKMSEPEGQSRGIYQTDGFDNAAYQLVIIIGNIGTGNIIIE